MLSNIQRDPKLGLTPLRALATFPADRIVVFAHPGDEGGDRQCRARHRGAGRGEGRGPEERELSEGPSADEHGRAGAPRRPTR